MGMRQSDESAETRRELLPEGSAAQPVIRDVVADLHHPFEPKVREVGRLQLRRSFRGEEDRRAVNGHRKVCSRLWVVDEEAAETPRTTGALRSSDGLARTSWAAVEVQFGECEPCKALGSGDERRRDRVERNVAQPHDVGRSASLNPKRAEPLLWEASSTQQLRWVSLHEIELADASCKSLAELPLQHQSRLAPVRQCHVDCALGPAVSDGGNRPPFTSSQTTKTSSPISPTNRYETVPARLGARTDTK